MSDDIKCVSPYDCGIAILMMATNRDRDSLVEWLGYDPNDTINHKVCYAVLESEILYALQTFRKDSRWSHYMCEDMFNDDHELRESMPFRKRLYDLNTVKLTLESGRESVLMVPSRNIPGEGHYVYWNGKELKDPSRSDRYKSLSDVTKVYSIIIRG